MEAKPARYGLEGSRRRGCRRPGGSPEGRRRPAIAPGSPGSSSLVLLVLCHASPIHWSDRCPREHKKATVKTDDSVNEETPIPASREKEILRLRPSDVLGAVVAAGAAPAQLAGVFMAYLWRLHGGLISASWELFSSPFPDQHPTAR